jgi:hypothetical protein
MSKNLKSVGSVVAGLATIIVLSGLASIIMTTTGIFPGGKLPLHGSLLVVIGILGYQAAIYLAGCFATIKLAPSKPVGHVLVLGGIGATLNLLSGLGLAMKDGAVYFWFYLGLSVLSLLTAWLSGKLYQKTQ